MGDGRKLCTHGHLTLPLRHRQYRGVQHWIKSNGVLLPEHVQRCTLWMDTGGIPGPDQGNCIRARKLLGSSVQHRFTLDCCEAPSQELGCSPVPCWRRGLHLHHRPHPYSNQAHRSEKLLRPCRRNQPLGYQDIQINVQDTTVSRRHSPAQHSGALLLSAKSCTEMV